MKRKVALKHCTSKQTEQRPRGAHLTEDGEVEYIAYSGSAAIARRNGTTAYRVKGVHQYRNCRYKYHIAALVRGISSQRYNNFHNRLVNISKDDPRVI